MKKKPFEIQRWMFLAGIPAIGAAIVICAKVIVAWAEVPGRVDKIEQYISAQVQANLVQAEANRLMSEQLKQQQQAQQSSCEQDRDGVWWCLDSVSRQWFKQGGQ